ncbi:MAG: hypothetical protein LBP93_03375 [Treponema sp.]|nr:hypothetical protein [Treponema sp.]
MRKPVFPRIVCLTALYAVVFIALVIVQFTKQGGFTHRVGNLVVSGVYGETPDSSLPKNANEYPLSGKASVFFGGLEFCLSDDDGLVLLNAQEEPEALSPEYMILSGETVLFRLSGGTELSFTTQYVGGTQELRINGVLPAGFAGLELPYRPLRSSKVRDSGDGQFIVGADGVNYSFGRSLVDEKRRVILLEEAGPTASYRAIPEKRAFDPADFIIPGAQDKRSYTEAITQWRDRSFSLWNRVIGNDPTEDMVIAYTGEAARRGTYKAAVSAIPAAFVNDPETYEASVYLGRLDLGLRSLASFERENASRLSRLINEKSPDILKEFHVFEYLGIRGYGSLIDDGGDIVRSIDPAVIPLDLSPGILEGWQDWTIYRPHVENPFERLINQACFVISEGIIPDPEGSRVFVFHRGEANTEFNFRLGAALITYGENAGQEDWAGLGRSLVLSVLSLVDASGMVPASLLFSEENNIQPPPQGSNPQGPRLNSARLYRILRPGEYDARAVGIGAAVNGIWTWTAASAISAAQENNVLDISASFPVGETHYMMIRGIRPFTKIQLYNIDYRTDPQFERYESSGWVYSASEQTLLLKMRHRTTVEHIRIFY